MIDREAAMSTFLDAQGWGGAKTSFLAGDASFRHYHRLKRGVERAVLMDAPPPQEDARSFVAIARHLSHLGYSAPRILAADEDQGLLLIEDLGDDTFTRLLAAGVDEVPLYGIAIDLLADLHRRGPSVVPEGLPAYDDSRLLAEAALLVDWYLPETGAPKLSAGEREEYLDIWRKLLPLARLVPDTLVLRDFHVDNLMRLPRPGLAACGLLDFQDAVAGPLTYDLMSLLEDARRDIPPSLASAMRGRYLMALPDLDPVAFAASWSVLAAQRHAKVIGIFTRLCRRDGKPIYLSHIPRVWRMLDLALAERALAPLRQWLDHHIPPTRRTVPIP